MTRPKIAAYIILVTGFLVSLAWVISAPSHEPILALLSAISALVGLLSSPDFTNDLNEILSWFQRQFQHAGVQSMVQQGLQTKSQIQGRLVTLTDFLRKNGRFIRRIAMLLFLIFGSLFLVSQYLNRNQQQNKPKELLRFAPDSSLEKEVADPATTPTPALPPEPSVTEEAQREIDSHLEVTFVACNGKRYTRHVRPDMFQEENERNITRIELSNLRWVIQAQPIPDVDREKNGVEWLGTISLVPTEGQRIYTREYKYGKNTEYTDKVFFGEGGHIEKELGARKKNGKWDFWSICPMQTMCPSYKPLGCKEAEGIFP